MNPLPPSFLVVRVVLALLASLLPACAAAPSGPPVELLPAVTHPGAVPHARIRGIPVPWGDLYFLDSERLLVPYAEIHKPTPEELVQERARRAEWLKRPTSEIVDELVHKTPGEPENVYRFRRWLAEGYVESIKANPEAVLEAETEDVRETGLRVLRVTGRGADEQQRIPVWNGRASVQDVISSQGGLGPQAISWTTPMVNLHVGVAAGERYVAAWSWPGVSGRPEDSGVPLAALILDRATLRVVAPLEEMRPVIWVGPDRLLVLRQIEGSWHPSLLEVSTTSGAVELRMVRTYPTPAFNRPASVFSLTSPVLLPSPSGGHPRFLLFRRGGKAIWLDLETGRSEAMGREVFLSPYGAFRLLGPRAWTASLSGSWWAVGIRDAGGRVVVDRHYKLPYEPLVSWEGPVAAARHRLLWGKDPGIRRELGRGAASGGSSNRLEFFWFYPETRSLRPVPLPIIPAKPPDGNGFLVSISPDQRWLAARVSEREVRIWAVADLGR